MSTAADPAADTPEPPPRHDPYAALRVGDFRLFSLGFAASVIGLQAMSVAVGWELYARTGSKAVLGLVGLVQVVPVLVLSLPAGHVADRFDRRRVLLLSQFLLAVIGAAMAWASFGYAATAPAEGRLPGAEVPASRAGPLSATNAAVARMAHALGETGGRFDDPYVPVLLGLLLLNAAARSVGGPARSAFLPELVPPSLFGNAVTWNSSIFEVCSMAGPAAGGGIIAALLGAGPAAAPWAYPATYLAAAACQLVFAVLVWPVRPVTAPRPREPLTVGSLSAGVRYVFTTPILLATLTLDLFAVILGGAVALLPVYAKDILHVGPLGLGALRAAPSVGAFLMATLIAHLPPMKRAGRNMLWAVAGFGAATVVFGYSRDFWLSLAMLALTGAFDNVSVVVRQTLVQVLTPDAMRGRVSAVNAIFIQSSNQIGTLESGFTAAVMGTVPSVVFGGVGTIVVVLLAAVAWPQLRRYGALTGPGHNA
ncbi:MAG TPA: MFS transporter [Humisphaera sp.]